ncbi:uncharacterized protein LOC128743373 isoform X2 [Sabethes cyaneus]|uniref:uncharacterized protein LOC128743373 isoform X2 n=1 Tax=Sabethes cyaneus TaxID=53552 RepID=UPI00237E5539|nr:uncharacterized protein LOC128743373 isoform X2 [Sabethes cyaneus]
MSPERHLAARNDSDGNSSGGGGAGTVIGGHITVESLSVPGSNSGQLDALSSVGSSMVLSTIPLEANQLILQQHLAHQHQQSQQQQQQQQHHIITSGNGSNQSNTNSSGSAISAASSVGSNHSIIINNNTSFKNHNNIIISSSNGGNGSNSNSSSNNHTYTINLSASHNGHAVLANGTGSIPIHSYAQPSVTGATSVNGSHSSHHLGQAFHHQLLHPAPNPAPSATLISASSMATAHSNGLTSSSSSASATTTVVAPTPQTSQPTAASMPSKLVLLQQGHLGENYITTTDGMNGVGNIVLLATEQMDMTSAEHDLLNNNVIITSTSTGNGTGGGHGSSTGGGHIIGHSFGGSNHSHHHHPLRNGTTTVLATSSGGVVVNADEELTPLTWLHDKNLLKGINLSKVPVSSPDSPSRQVGGHLSPTSDFVEDSSVSEDNTSSANSSSDQSIGVYCTETIHPSGRPAPAATASSHHHTFQLGSGSQRTITTLSGETIVEYPINSSEEKELKSPSSTVSCASSSSPPSSSSSLYNSSPSPASSSGQAAAPPAAHSGSNSGSSTPHQHFHKKYLREEHVKQLKQVSSSYVTPVKQQPSAIKYEEGEIVDDRPYPPAPVKNGYQMAASPTHGSSDEYSGTYGTLSSMKPPSSPPLSPQHMNGSGSIVGIHPLVPPPSLSSPQPPSNNSMGSGQHSPAKLSPPKAKHPTNVPYDPHVHVHSKPPFSFSSLIFMAIENCQQKALPVKEIYAWIVHHFPYFKTAPTGWKNSVRHNLSLNKCFQKVEKAADSSLQNLGKGSLWMVEPQYRPNLIQALSRSPFHSGSGIDKTTYKAMQAQQQQQQQQQQHQRSTDSPTSSVGSSYSKDNFPYLASRLAPGETANGSHGHHALHGQQQHPDLDGDDFSRSSTPIDYDGDLPQPSSLSVGPYHVTYHQPHHHHHHHHGGPPLPPESAFGGGSTTSGGCPGSTGGGGDAVGRDWSADTIDDVNAATAMLALKHGPKIFTEGFQNGTPPVITTSPSEDHTYSAGGGIQTTGASGRSSQVNSDNNSNGTSSDAAYESSEESQNMPVADDLEEQRRQAGVDALLNLAGITDYASAASTIQQHHHQSSSLKRPASTPYDSGHQSPYQQASTAVAAAAESTPPSGYSSVLVAGGGQAATTAQQPSFRSNYYMPDDLSQYSSPSPPKKSKPSSARMLKKFKKKASWVR